MLVKKSLCNRLVCSVGFAGMTLLACFTPTSAFHFLLPLVNFFLKVCLPTFFADILGFFPPLLRSANSASTSFNKSAPTRSAAGTIYLHENGTPILPITCQVHRVPVHIVDQYFC